MKNLNELYEDYREKRRENRQYLILENPVKTKKEETGNDIYDLELCYADMGMQTYQLVKKEQRNKCMLRNKKGSRSMKEERNTSGRERSTRSRERQRIKTKTRATKKWKELRQTIAELQHHLDPITKNKLTKTFNLHHYDQSFENYDKLDNLTHFRAYNNMSHKCVHFLYSIAKRDGLNTLLERLRSDLKIMLIINHLEEMIDR